MSKRNAEKSASVSYVEISGQFYNFAFNSFLGMEEFRSDIYWLRSDVMAGWKRVKGCGNDAIIAKATELRASLTAIGLL